MNNKKLFSIEDLSAKTGLSKRNIRYYIQKGLVNSPIGKGKGAYYTDNHLEQLQETVKWKKEGLSLGRIQNIVRGLVSEDLRSISSLPCTSQISSTSQKSGTSQKDVETWTRLFITQGIDLNVNTSATGLTLNECRQIQKIICSVVSNYIEENIDKKK